MKGCVQISNNTMISLDLSHNGTQGMVRNANPTMAFMVRSAKEEFSDLKIAFSGCNQTFGIVSLLLIQQRPLLTKSVIPYQPIRSRSCITKFQPFVERGNGRRIHSARRGSPITRRHKSVYMAGAIVGVAPLIVSPANLASKGLLPSFNYRGGEGDRVSNACWFGRESKWISTNNNLSSEARGQCIFRGLLTARPYFKDDKITRKLEESHKKPKTTTRHALVISTRVLPDTVTFYFTICMGMATGDLSGPAPSTHETKDSEGEARRNEGHHDTLSHVACFHGHSLKIMT
ncbi:hypothetical protein JTE90_005647 [Oedothorax gibbosus]|uniref:Uncharacterized protein n=1 Tax=Oedothorax gibbosus TaxID=931172 RepID=A0AAV6UIQ3_9ARAC|nr:hypothetical protein JTE90_005647 [Oedothorax gibbosus]